MENEIIQIINVSKEYRLGQIGGTTLKEELQRRRAKRHGLEDPRSKIGSKKYNNKDTFLALDGVSLTINAGERVGIIGHNGAGKSTLLKLISRITVPTEGSITLGGRVTSMLEVGTGFHGELTGRENIYLNGTILGMTKKEIDEKLEDIIEFSECRKFIDTPVKRYSSGMFVKLAFSVAAFLENEIMIMDEVLAVGDVPFQTKCLQKMKDIAKDRYRTILYVSHNMKTIRELCDRCIVLSHGKLIYDGDVDHAIGIYYESAPNKTTKIDFTKIPRLEWLYDTRVRITYAEFLNQRDVMLKAEDPLEIRLDWINESDVENLSLRMELLHADRSPIGTYVIENFYSGKQGDSESKVFVLDLSSVASGSYAINYNFFIQGIGGSQFADRVHGQYFDVINQEMDRIKWVSANWGSVEFPTIKILNNL